MNNLKVLDCTIRDGGYYNNWDFSDDEFINSIDALINTGVDVIELGYKSLGSAQFFGPYKYCSETFLRELKMKTKCQYACMIDAKEFVNKKSELNVVLLDQEASIFSMVRVASSLAILNESIDLALEIKRKGYLVSLNLMGISLISENDLALLLAKIPKEIDIVYFADSFGNLYPKDVARIFNVFKNNLSGQDIGFHPHDNLGLAFANAIEAIECGVDYIDGTILGMGRGAGNLKLEQLLTFLNFEKKDNKYSSYPLIYVIQNHYLALQKEYGWGFDLTYMLSGINNTHQSYCQSLKLDRRYNYQQVFDILSNISPEKRAKFEKDELNRSMERTFSFKKKKTLGSLAEVNNENVLIVAKGESVLNSKESLDIFIKEKKPLIFDCNNTEVFKQFSRYVCMINVNKINDFKHADANVKGVIHPFDTRVLPLDIENISIGYTLGQALSFELDAVGLFAYLVGQYSIMVALSLGVTNIYLAGFDGFVANNDEKTDMEYFFSILSNSSHSSEIISLTPTKYNIKEKSVFSILQDEKIQSRNTSEI
jgi:4-hydroxy 2-oxovalerate aldolase